MTRKTKRNSTPKTIMKNISISSDELQTPFITPPANGGQIVEVSYSSTEDYIIERTVDRSDKSETILAYQWGGDKCEPQNTAPKLGKLVGSVVIE